MNRKYLFFFSITLTTVILIPFFVPPVVAARIDIDNPYSGNFPEGYDVMDRNLRVNPVLPTGTGYEQYYFEIGNERLTHFQQLSSVRTDQETMLLHAQVIMTCQVNIYSAFTFEDYVNFEQKTATGTYATIRACTDWNHPNEWYPCPETRTCGELRTVFDYDMQYSYNYYEMSLKNTQGIQGFIPIEASVIDLTPKSIDFGDLEFTYSTSSIYSNLVKGKIRDSKSDEIADYLDNFVGGSQVDKKETFMDRGVDSSVSQITQVKAQELTDELNQLGFEDLAAPRFGASPSGGQGLRQAPTIGSSIHQYISTYGSPGIIIKLRPHVNTYVQDLGLWYSQHEIRIDTQEGFDSHAGIVDGYGAVRQRQALTRLVGWHIQNYNIQFDLELDFDLFGIADLSFYETNEDFGLGIPDLTFGDVFWDLTITGDTDIDLKFSESFWANLANTLQEDWWRYAIAIVIIAGVIIFLRRRRSPTQRVVIEGGRSPRVRGNGGRRY
jgi:hypothetical protein